MQAYQIKYRRHAELNRQFAVAAGLVELFSSSDAES